MRSRPEKRSEGKAGRRRRACRVAGVVRVGVVSLLCGLFFILGRAQAQYLGLEPDRLVGLLEIPDHGADVREARLRQIDSLVVGEPVASLSFEKGQILAAQGRWKLAEKAFREATGELPAARLGLAVALARQGKAAEALEGLGAEAGATDPRIRYARVLLMLAGDPEVKFASLREELRSLARDNPTARDFFDLWLGLNPRKKELRRALDSLTTDNTQEDVWRRCEILSRLGEAEQVLDAIHGLGEFVPEDSELPNRLAYLEARSYFQLGSDRAGLEAYARVVQRLDERTAELLYRDVAAIAHPDERAQFAKLSLTEKKYFFQSFWKRRDPLPLDAGNPRVGEHYRRLAVALDKYALQSTGRGYFTDRDVFFSLSPSLGYYDSEVTYELGPASRYWLDHRGLIVLRHGEPDRTVGPISRGGIVGSESWAVNRLGARRWLFHFVRRPSVGEWTLVLNLGVATTVGAPADEPNAVSRLLTSGFTRLYGSRQRLDPWYLRLDQVRSRSHLESFLRAESEQMASFLQVATATDSTDYFTKDNTLPLDVSVSSFRTEDGPAAAVEFAVDLSVVDRKKLDRDSTLEARLLVYDRQGMRLKADERQVFQLSQIPAKGSDILFGSFELRGVEQEADRIVLQVSQDETQRVSIKSGLHAFGELEAGDLGMSDLFLRQGVGLKNESEVQWLPAPSRAVRRGSPSHIRFELYNLQADERGTAHYEIEERVETLFETPGVLRQLAGLANVAGQMVFPLYAVAGGTAGLLAPPGSGTVGVRQQERVVEREAEPRVVEELELDLGQLKPGVYTVHVTVRDLETQQLDTRSLTVAVT